MSHLKMAVFIFFFSASLSAEDLPYFKTKELPARDYFKKGLIHLFANRYSAARENFIKALSIKEDFILAREYLSSTYFLGGQWSDSLNELEILDSQNKLNQVLKNRAEFLRLLLGGIPKSNERVFEKSISGDDFRGYRFANPVDVAVDEKGNLFILSFKTANVVKINPNGDPVLNFKGSMGRNLRGPIAISYYNHKLYIADLAADMIYIFSDTGNYINRFGSTGSEMGKFHGPSGIFVNKSGIYVSDSGNNRIQKFTVAGKIVQEFGQNKISQLKQPADLQMQNNHLFVVDKGNSRIIEYNNEGYYLKSYKTENMIQPRSLLIREGKMFITDEKAGILIYNFNDNSWSKWSDLVKAKVIDIPFAIINDYTESYYTVDFNRHRIDIFTPKNKLLSNLDVLIEKIDVSRFSDLSVFLRVKNRSNQDIKGIDRLAFRLFENGNPSPLIGLANMDKFNQQITVSLIFENSKEVVESHNNLEYILGSFFRSFKMDDKLQMIKSGNDSTLVYNYGHSMYDIFSLIRNSTPEKKINLGKAIYNSIANLTSEIGPRAVILFVSGKNNKYSFNQFSISKLIQFARAHSIPIYVLSLNDKSSINKTYKNIADSTGGQYLTVPGNNKINNLYQNILAKQDNRYIISFNSRVDKSLTGRYIPIEVDLRYRNQYGKAEAGYFIPENK